MSRAVLLPSLWAGVAGPGGDRGDGQRHPGAGQRPRRLARDPGRGGGSSSRFPSGTRRPAGRCRRPAPRRCGGMAHAWRDSPRPSFGRWPVPKRAFHNNFRPSRRLRLARTAGAGETTCSGSLGFSSRLRAGGIIPAQAGRNSSRTSTPGPSGDPAARSPRPAEAETGLGSHPGVLSQESPGLCRS